MALSMDCSSRLVAPNFAHQCLESTRSEGSRAPSAQGSICHPDRVFASDISIRTQHGAERLWVKLSSKTCCIAGINGAWAQTVTGSRRFHYRMGAIFRWITPFWSGCVQFIYRYLYCRAFARFVALDH